jgi:very-short-patch-repair endonuclease
VHRVEHRVRTGQLAPLHRGVYRASWVTGPRAREMGAILACGPSAVLGDRSAASLWSVGAADLEARVDVLVRGRTPARRAGIRSRAARDLEDDEVTIREGVPVTTLPRTLVDLARTVTVGELEQALALADRAGVLDAAAVLAVVARRPRRAGSSVLRSLLEAQPGPALTRSEAESELLRLVRQSPLPAPETNVRVDGFEVDFLWRPERLVVEVDGFAYHSSRSAFERDRRRDTALTTAGYRVVRLTWRQIKQEPIRSIVTVALALRLPPGPFGPTVHLGFRGAPDAGQDGRAAMPVQGNDAGRGPGSVRGTGSVRPPSDNLLALAGGRSSSWVVGLRAAARPPPQSHERSSCPDSGAAGGQ